jgi:hypothetical protein
MTNSSFEQTIGAAITAWEKVVRTKHVSNPEHYVPAPTRMV